MADLGESVCPYCGVGCRLRLEGSGGQVTRIRVLANRANAHAAKPAQLVIGGHDATVRPIALAVQKHTKVVTRSLSDMLHGTGSRDVSIIVLDADVYGLPLVKQIREIFPSTPVVGLSNNATTLVLLGRAGAIAVPANTPTAAIAALVTRVLHGHTK